MFINQKVQKNATKKRWKMDEEFQQEETFDDDDDNVMEELELDDE